MFSKMYDVNEGHIDFQEVVDGLYYPFYMEWERHAFMKEALGIDIEGEFSQGRTFPSEPEKGRQNGGDLSAGKKCEAQPREFLPANSG